MRVLVVLALIVFNLALAGLMANAVGGYSDTFQDYQPDQDLTAIEDGNIATALMDLVVKGTQIFWLDLLIVRPTQLIIAYEIVQHIPYIGS